MVDRSSIIDISLPEDFINRYTDLIGLDQFRRYEQSIRRSLSPSIRVNRSKNFSPDLRPIQWCEDGFYTDRSIHFGADPLWYAGCYYVQEPASMFLEQYLKQYNICPKKALDMCAAPGVKALF